ncbi:GntR family transcriptional regulator [Gelria sp. Kuro-4]|uniref:GntR family transcriptional regulator n=1 Tax=Gelria sp. Kuro-4 TaxID=2796927 RepID=UPI001BF1200F|nr:GntR family transcriptional regulator [Gelria sp. Kuro-4]BCV24164.1 GntR family transcriptional regulator [Gelria sp. Kuro-4]
MAVLPRLKNNADTLAEQAYAILKKAIVNNKFKPREILSEEKLAADLGISRTPIRAALSRLAMEKLVSNIPGRGSMVADISLQDVEDLFVVREALEGVSAKLATKNITAQEMVQMKHFLQQQRDSLANADYLPFLEADMLFHAELARISKNRELYEIILSLQDRILRFEILSNTIQSRAAKALREHKDILDALEQGDPALVEQKIIAHIRSVLQSIREAEAKKLS